MTWFVAWIWLAAPPTPDALSESAQQMARERRYDDAARLWKQAIALSPRHFPSWFNLGLMRHSQGNFVEAERPLRQAASIRPDDFNAHYILGSTLANLGRRDAALAEWRIALRLQPANLKLMQIMAVEYGKGWYFQEACELGRRALSAGATDVRAHIVAVKACSDSRDSGTLELARQAALKFPGSAQANFEYAFQLQRAGRREHGRPYLEKAMQVDPYYEEPFFFYGEQLLIEDRFDEAVEPLRHALKIRGDYVAACVALARALMGLERDREAVAELDKCAARNPAHPQPHLVLSQLWFRLGDEAKARTEKETSLRLRRENPTLMEAPQSRPFPKTGAIP